ncbi:MAG: transposase, partial [Chloroflexi bacterium]|nr:transposase [Chloroflexota bacterium]
GIQAETASLDRWFHVGWFLQQVLAAGYRRVVVPDRVDRHYGYQGQQMTGAAIRATIPLAEFQPALYKGKQCRLAARNVEHATLGSVKLVFVEEFNHQGQPTRCYALLCTDPDYPDELVYRAHKLRWKIEEGYREMRQNHGFGAFHSRNWNAIYGHLTFVFLSLLLTGAIRRFNTRIASQTLGWIKKHYLNAVVELREETEALVILFSQGFLQRFGLFQLAPGVDYVNW